MKINRTYIFIAISSVALIALLFIQLSWIVQTAKIKEDIFNEKANMVLSRTTEALLLDKETCKEIGECVDKENESVSVAVLGKREAKKIDSLFTYYMKFYNFHIDYTFVVSKQNLHKSKNNVAYARSFFNKPMEEIATKNGLELNLIFPDKKHYIMAEMGSLFITSVLLIVIVLVLFWRSMLSLMKEKKVSEHTTDFLNNMTHEFKTPLTSIALAGRMIYKDSESRQADKIKQYTEIILEENEKLRLQVEQVLSMTALERGEIPLQKSRLDFHQLIHDLLKYLNIQIETHQGKMLLSLNARNSMISGDKTHLTNALSNLIDNAIKYSDKNPEISISTYNREQDLIVEIQDKGIGIEKKYQKKIFDNYFRVPTGDRHDVKGFGLGLSYTKKIIELHGGTIELKSQKNKNSSAESENTAGTTFIIRLPNE